VSKVDTGRTRNIETSKILLSHELDEQTNHKMEVMKLKSVPTKCVKLEISKEFCQGRK